MDEKLNKVVPIYMGGATTKRSYSTKPWIVEVNDERLKDSRGTPRRYKDSMSAGIAGAKEVDRRRAVSEAENP